KPFFVYLPTNAPHSPYWLPQSYREAMTRRLAEVEASGAFTKKLAPKKRQEIIDFLAMIENIDDNVGRLDAFLKEQGLLDDTVLVFLTDNGSTQGADYYNAGMWGRKTTLWEGGHRVPCFIRYPKGGFGKPRDVHGLAEVQDLLPTLLDLTGVAGGQEVDGVSLAPVLRGKAAMDEDRVLVINYSRMPFQFEYAAPDSPSRMRREGAAVLWKNWRLLEDRELYDLTTDKLQRHNVIEEHPEVVARLRAHLDDWWDSVKELANEAQPVMIGHPKENPVMLTACEWLDVFVDQQQQVRRADRKNGWWEIEVAQEGTYEFELRRWPREADLPLDGAMGETKITDGVLPAGVSLPIARARMQLGAGPMQVKPVQPGDKAANFTQKLAAGRTRLYTWFDDAAQQALMGAYYVYVTRKD
ncbi:MAG: sulfatase-like hydrolase/transferase, partial [Verrucomicrobiales bacterium]|nr:sulfatase-like hydrolase/transferase [Verrucomicrobiales bacterium]